MNVFKRFYANSTTRRFFILALIGLLLYMVRGMLNLVLLTFLIAFVMNSFQIVLSKRIGKFMKVNSKVIIVILYLALIALIVLTLVKYLPKVLEQIKQLAIFLTNLKSEDLPQNKITLYLYDMLRDLNYQSYIKRGIDYVLQVSNWGATFVLSTILSFVFILEKNRVVSFTSRMRESRIAWFYIDLEYFSRKFIVSFGKVIEAQILIAMFNTCLTVIGLWLLNFPYLFALAILIFLLSLIPVVGFLISLIPLLIIGYNIGGLITVTYVLAIIAVLHFIEGYFLNPKLMSTKMNLPMFFTFSVLLFSEHYIGVWGLILGIPIFVFMLDILEITHEDSFKRANP